MTRILKAVLAPTSAASAAALDELWTTLPDEPALCWYPSAGNCFRDLLVWRHYAGLRSLPEPDLFIHTDYVADVDLSVGRNDGRTEIEVIANHELAVDDSIEYRVDPDHVSLPGLALERPEARLLQVRAWTASVGEIIRPVLFFRFENFNWFRSFVLQGGLAISHLFKLREGCGFGGNRTSIANLYPWLRQAGVRYVVADQEVHIDQHLIDRLRARHATRPALPFRLQALGELGRLSDLDVMAWRLAPAVAREDWLEAVYCQLTEGSVWSNPTVSPGSGQPWHAPGLP